VVQDVDTGDLSSLRGQVVFHLCDEGLPPNRQRDSGTEGINTINVAALFYGSAKILKKITDVSLISDSNEPGAPLVDDPPVFEPNQSDSNPDIVSG
jgi:hypothetical protein